MGTLRASGAPSDSCGPLSGLPPGGAERSNICNAPKLELLKIRKISKLALGPLRGLGPFGASWPPSGLGPFGAQGVPWGPGGCLRGLGESSAPVHMGPLGGQARAAEHTGLL